MSVEQRTWGDVTVRKKDEDGEKVKLTDAEKKGWLEAKGLNEDDPFQPKGKKGSITPEEKERGQQRLEALHDITGKSKFELGMERHNHDNPEDFWTALGLSDEEKERMRNIG